MILNIGDVITATTANYTVTVKILDITLLTDSNMPGVSIQVEHTFTARESDLKIETVRESRQVDSILFENLIAWLKQVEWSKATE